MGISQCVNGREAGAESERRCGRLRWGCSMNDWGKSVDCGESCSESFVGGC
jgi:hypothetical protein